MLPILEDLYAARPHSIRTVEYYAEALFCVEQAIPALAAIPFITEVLQLTQAQDSRE